METGRVEHGTDVFMLWIYSKFSQKKGAGVTKAERRAAAELAVILLEQFPDR